MTQGADEIEEIDLAVEDVGAGDRINYCGTLVTITSGPEAGKDIFGRPILAFQGIRADTGAAGHIIFGANATLKRWIE